MARVKRAEETRLLAPILESQTLDDANARQRKANSFHASSIEDCGRKQWYSIMGYKPDMKVADSQWTRDAAAGEAIHEQYQEMLVRSDVVLTVPELSAITLWNLEDKSGYAIELSLPRNEYNIGGRMDAVVRIDGVVYILDIKTVSDKHFQGIKGYGHYKMKKYIAQLQTYMHLTGIHNALILLVSRNDSTMREFLVSYDKEWCEKQFARIAKLKEYLDEGRLPPREPDYNGCSFCEFAMTCVLDGE